MVNILRSWSLNENKVCSRNWKIGLQVTVSWMMKLMNDIPSCRRDSSCNYQDCNSNDRKAVHLQKEIEKGLLEETEWRRLVHVV